MRRLNAPGLTISGVAQAQPAAGADGAAAAAGGVDRRRIVSSLTCVSSGGDTLDGSGQREATIDEGAIRSAASARLTRCRMPRYRLASRRGDCGSVARSAFGGRLRGQFGASIRDRRLASLLRAFGATGGSRAAMGSARRLAQACRASARDTSNGAWWDDRCGNTSGRPAASASFGAERQSSAARAAPPDMVATRRACEKAGEDADEANFAVRFGHGKLR